jgi:hypothetical protein
VSGRERIAIAPTDRASRQTCRPVEVLTGARVLTLAEVEQWQTVAFDCNGAARALDLPPVGHCQGVYLHVTNATAATHALTVRDAAAATVVAVPAGTPNRSAKVWCDGVRWFALLGA